jgi:hypothetical protein
MTAGMDIKVDMVTRTKGFIFMGSRQGIVLNDAKREGGQPGDGWSVEDEDGRVVASGIRGMRTAVKAFARHHGHKGPLSIEVDEEWRLTGQKD